MKEPYAKPIKGEEYKGLWELRIKFASDISRIFYFMPIGNSFVLLHGFVKKTDKIPKRELETAKSHKEVSKMSKPSTPWSEVKNRLLKDPETAKAYYELEPEYEIISEIIKARIEQNISQEELARRVGTRQANISRLESGSYNPSIRFLKKVGEGLGKKLHITFS